MLSLDEQKFLILIKSNIAVFSLMVSAYYVFMKLLSRNFIDLPSTFRSVMYLELIVVNLVKLGIKVHVCPHGYPAPFIEKDHTFPTAMQCHLCLINHE